MKRKYIFLIILVVVIAAMIIANLRAKREKGIDVQVEKVQRRDLAMIISASGSIRPKRMVDVSASNIGKVTKVAVKEGDRVRKGQFLLQIDPMELESTVARFEAALEAARANEKLARAKVRQAKSDLERAQSLYEKGYLTEQDVENARANYEIALSQLESARHSVEQQKANLESAKHNLKEVTIKATMDGVVTRLNVEEGEIAIMGTLNNPGTVLLTIADLSTIEAEVEVDETEVVDIELGDTARVTLDAFPDTSFVGVVTEIGNSPIYSSSVSSQQGVDFKVVITILDTIPNVRPGLSADAEITVEKRKDALSVPIQSLTVRRRKDIKSLASDSTLSEKEREKEIEGVFVVENGRAYFRPVRVGISSQKYFEVVSGLKEGEVVVTGNYKAIRELRDGQKVKVVKKSRKKKK